MSGNLNNDAIQNPFLSLVSNTYTTLNEMIALMQTQVRTLGNIINRTQPLLPISNYPGLNTSTGFFNANPNINTTGNPIINNNTNSNVNS